MSWMTGLNEIALSLWAGLDFFFFPLLIWPLVAGLLAQRLLQAGTPTGLRLVTLRVLTSSRLLCLRLQTLWVTLFFYFGVLKLKEILSGGARLEGFGPSLLSTVHLPL